MASSLRGMFARRLVSVCTYSRLRGVSGAFSTASVRRNDGGREGSDPPGPVLLPGRRRALSPLERLRSLLPRDALNPEVEQLRDPDVEQLRDPDVEQGGAHLEEGGGASPGGVSPILHTAKRDLIQTERPPLPGEAPLVPGELLMAEHRRRRVEFRRLFLLQAGGRLQSNVGVASHDDIIGRERRPLPGEAPLVPGELLMAEHRRRRVEFRRLFLLQAGGAAAEQYQNGRHGSPPPQERRPLPGEAPLVPGELLMAEHRRRRVEFRRLFLLQAGGRLQSNVGVASHDDIIGRENGRVIKTSRGAAIFVRRASLEDYVLHMKRGPAIAYPKDAAHMLLMMDVGPGQQVLEAGSGSGAMSLFLSRAVGSSGGVLSLEVRLDHWRMAVRNYDRWRASWACRHGNEWPDNVRFLHADLGNAAPLLAGRGFHAVALDLVDPQRLLPAVLPHLHPGAVCAVYLANITQVVDLLDGVRCCALPLRCERILEVSAREWLVTPALRKDGQYHTREAPGGGAGPGGGRGAGPGPRSYKPIGSRYRIFLLPGGNTTEEDVPAFGSVPYIARPHPEQMSHTAFLVKLRKWVP
ncbi:tRNA (adenine(58)-N(1))-methyltransferase, mitochondrial [Menidia menidia]